jgi:hypothetical protein
LGDTAPIDQAPDMTIFGPLGGEAGRPDNARQQRTASKFLSGTGSTEIVSLIQADDLVVVVAIDRNDVIYEGETTPRPWTLRTTQVFRRDGDTWIRLHRHADTLIRRRTLAEARTQLEG